MEINRVGAEMLLTTLLTGVFCQLIRAFYQLNQMGEWAYFCLLALTNICVIAAVYYLKRGRDASELALLVLGVMVGLWTSN